MLASNYRIVSLTSIIICSSFVVSFRFGHADMMSRMYPVTTTFLLLSILLSLSLLCAAESVTNTTSQAQAAPRHTSANKQNASSNITTGESGNVRNHVLQSLPDRTSKRERTKSAKNFRIQQGLLLYEVEKRMRGLSAEDIQDVFSTGPRVFAFALAHKLGYRYNESDPHVSVIKANKDNLMRRLNETLVKSSKPSIGSDVSEPKSAAVKTPKQVTKSHQSKNKSVQNKPEGLIAFEVEKGLQNLSVEAIAQVLDYDRNDVELAGVISRRLGFDSSKEDGHYQYLVVMGDSKLRTKLEMILRNKTKAETQHGSLSQSAVPDSSNPTTKKPAAKTNNKMKVAGESTERTGAVDDRNLSDIKTVPDRHDVDGIKNLEISGVNAPKGRVVDNDETPGNSAPNNHDDYDNSEPNILDYEDELDESDNVYNIDEFMLTDIEFQDFLEEVDPHVYNLLHAQPIVEIDEDTLEVVREIFNEWLENEDDESKQYSLQTSVPQLSQGLEEGGGTAKKENGAKMAKDGKPGPPSGATGKQGNDIKDDYLEEQGIVSKFNDSYMHDPIIIHLLQHNLSRYNYMYTCMTMCMCVIQSLIELIPFMYVWYYSMYTCMHPCMGMAI